MKITRFISNFIRNTSSPVYKRGEYGYLCKRSKPLEDFSKVLDRNPVIHCVATPDEIGGTYLQGSFSDALATQGVYNCAYISLYDTKNQQQAIHHVYAYDNYENIQKTIQKIMPKGFDKVCIIAGESEGTEFCAKEIFKAVKKIKRAVRIIYRHLNQESPAIISYNGRVYELPKSKKDTISSIPEPSKYLCHMLK